MKTAGEAARAAGGERRHKKGNDGAFQSLKSTVGAACASFHEPPLIAAAAAAAAQMVVIPGKELSSNVFNYNFMPAQSSGKMALSAI